MRARYSFRLLTLLALALHARAQQTVPPPTTPPATTAPATQPASATTPPPPPPPPLPVVDDDGDDATPLETPAGAPLDILTVKAGQTVVRATYRLIGTGATTPLPAGAVDDLLAALVSGSSPPGALGAGRVAALRTALAFVPLKPSASTRRRLLYTDNATGKGTPLPNTVDILIQADAGREAGVQAAYDAARAAAYAGSLQGGLRAAGWPWAVVLTGAAAARPGDPWPAADDWCRARLGSACLDGSGLGGAGAKGLIAAGVILVLLGTALALVATDRRRAGRRAEGSRMSAMLTGTVLGTAAGGRGAPAGAVVEVSVAGGGGGGEKRGVL